MDRQAEAGEIDIEHAEPIAHEPDMQNEPNSERKIQPASTHALAIPSASPRITKRTQSQ